MSELENADEINVTDTLSPADTAGTIANQTRAFFGVLLWYATGNKLVTISDPEGTTAQTKVAVGSADIRDSAATFAILYPQDKFKTLIDKFEKAIATGFSSQGYAVLGGNNTFPVGNINFGAALKVVGELFQNLIGGDYATTPPPHYPQDPTCGMVEILGIVPPPQAAPPAAS